MKLLRNLLLASCVITSFSAFAETKIGVVDIRAALFSSDAAKAFSQEMEGEFKTQEMEVRAVQESGQKLQERIKKDAAIMSDSERTKLALQLEEKAKEFKYLKGKLDKAVSIKKQDFIQSVADALQYLSYYHPVDFIKAVSEAYQREESKAAKDALAHPYFKTQPRPKLKSEMPSFPTLHSRVNKNENDFGEKF